MEIEHKCINKHILKINNDKKKKKSAWPHMG